MRSSQIGNILPDVELRFTNPFESVGSFAKDYASQIRRDEAEAQRQKEWNKEFSLRQAAEDRAKTLFDQQQEERQKLEYANQLMSVNKDTLAASDPRFEQAMQYAQSKGVDTGSLGAGNVLSMYERDKPLLSNVNIGANVPNVGGTAGRTIYKNVAVQGGTSPQQAQQTQPTPIAQPKGINLDTSGFISVNDMNKPVNTSTGITYLSTPYGADTRTTKPSMSITYTPTANVKSDKILTPTTPKQISESKNQVGTIMQKVAVGVTSGTPPKLNQIEAATLDKIYGAIDPNAQTREQARETMDSMLFSLGLNPKQVKEYSDIAVEGAYGKAGDPVRMALANAKANAYEKNIDATNRLGERIYAENRADIRQERSDKRAERAGKTSEDSMIKSLKTALGKNIVERLDPKNVAALQDSIYNEELKKAQMRSGWFTSDRSIVKEAEDKAKQRVIDMVAQYEQELAKIQVP